MLKRWLWAVAGAVALAGCGANNSGKCMQMSPGPIAAQAKSFHVNVYNNGACDGDVAAPSAGSPILSKSFLATDPLVLDVPPGMHVVVLTAYSDDIASVLIGSACAVATFSPGAPACVQLKLDAPPDMAAGSCDASCPCTQAPDSCPSKEYCTDGKQCAPGCKGDPDCTAPQKCAVARHLCVDCLDNTDCMPGKICSPSGTCVAGCAMSSDCPMGQQCCSKLCIDVRSDPLNCNGCGLACNGNLTLCCNAACTDPLTDVAHCGDCMTACVKLNGVPACATGKCTWACDPGFGHCMAGNTGCESPLNTVDNCSGCGKKCDQSNASAASCDGKACSYTCKPGFGDCTMVGANTDGCETQLNTILNCGGCGNRCDIGNAMSASCDGTKCSYVCQPTFLDCDMAGANTNGCETPITDPKNCGGCGKTCDVTNAMSATCDGTKCSYTCKVGFADCNLANGDLDGCETPANTTMSCGGCGNTCNLVNAQSATCDGTQCHYVCKPGFGDCVQNGANTDGCETALNTTNHCSACGVVCDTMHSNGATCDGTTCKYASCAAGYADCMMAAPDADGCETNLNAGINCGGCGKICDTLHSVGAQCINGGCQYAGCQAGYADCVAGAPDYDGCETNTASNVNNCGGCNMKCNPVNASGAMCNGGQCSYTCNAGFANCVVGNTMGCETNVNTSASNCGGCAMACSNVNATPQCTNGSCTSPCNAGFANCNNTLRQNGCNVNVLADPMNCGTCGKVCANGANVASMKCVAGGCQIASCNAGFADCDGNPANGCEVNTNSSTSNCGGCGVVCSGVNDTPQCTNGACTSPCNAGFANCDNTLQKNGCNVALNTDKNNCGGCGNLCNPVSASAASCAAGVCSYTCNANFIDCDKANAPNTDGCECSGNMCNGTMCVQQHINGLGQTYVDLADPLGTPGNAATYNLTMATDAAAAWMMGASAQCQCGAGGGKPLCVLVQTVNSCAVWQYTQTLAGYVHLNNGNNTCFCPSNGDPTWN